MPNQFDRVTPEMMLATTKKLLAIRNDEAEPDDRDSLANQTFHGPEDFFSERVEKDAGGIGRRVLWRSTGRNKLTGVNSGTLTPQMHGVLLSSGLGMPLEEINPIEIYDQHQRVLRLGEGGIPCYSDDTEVLTQGGWKRWEDVRYTDKLACRIGGRLEFHAPVKLYKHPYSGSMYGGHTKRINYLVTPEHRHWVSCPTVKNGKEVFKKYCRRSAEDLHGKKARHLISHDYYEGGVTPATFILPPATCHEANRGSSNRCAREFPAVLWAKLVGVYLAGGSCTWSAERGEYRVLIAKCKSKNPKEFEAIAELLDTLEISYKYRRGKEFVVYGKEFAEYFHQFGGEADKYIPNWIMESSYECREAFLSGVLMGGVSRSSGHLYSSASMTLRDQVAMLAVLQGNAVSYHTRVKDDQRPQYQVLIQEKEYVTISQQKKCNQFYTTQYDGYVYCAEVPGSLLFVRRDGKAMWSGNSREAIPEEAKSVQPSQFGYIDPFRGPESEALGVDTRLTFGTFKGDDNQVYSNFRDVRTGKNVKISAPQASKMVIAFPGEMDKPGKVVRAMSRGKLEYVNKSEVDLELPTVNEMFNMSTNLVPMASATQGNRLLMAGKMTSQALPLYENEAPLVRTDMRDGISTEELLGRRMGTVFSGKGGRVVAVRKNKITVEDASGEKTDYPLYVNHPFNRKTFLHNTPLVKAGDEVKPGQLLAKSNFTDDSGHTAVGKNLRVAFVPWKGMSVSGNTPVLWRDSNGMTHYTPIREVDTSHGLRANALRGGEWTPTMHRVHSYIAHRTDESMVRVTTLDGDEVITTKSHSFVTLDDSGKLIPIRPSDMETGKTAVPVIPLQGLFYGRVTSIHEPAGTAAGAPLELDLDADAGFLFGVYVAKGAVLYVKHDGRADRLKSVRIAVTEPELLDRLKLICEANGWSYKCRTRQDPNGVSGSVTIGSAVLARTLSRLCGHGAASKCVPEFIWDAPREFVEGFIDGYWCGDGTVSDKQATASTASPRLASELCALLSGLGVRATTRVYRYAGNLPQCTVKIFRHTLVNMPALTSGRKNEALQKLQEKGSSHSSDRVPVPAAYRAAVGKAIGWPVPTCGYVSRAVLSKVMDKLPDEVRALVEAPVWWDVVSVVEETENEEVVYDLDMRPISNFAVGSGLVVHNTFEDGYVLSESAAKKLASEHMYTPAIDKTEGNVSIGYNKFISMYPTKYSKDQLKVIDKSGVVKPGTRLKKGDPIILAIGQADPRAEGQWSNLSRKSSRSTRDRTVEWEHDFEGEVTDIVDTKNGVEVAVRAYVPIQDADKISGRFGDKGTVRVVPDDQMPRDKEGKPFDVIQNPLTLPTRMNPAQIYEMQLSKVARKTGKPVLVPQTMEGSYRDWVESELRKHGLSDTEDIVDPENERSIRSILTGEKFFMKLHHTAEGKWGASDETGGYTAEGVPSKGGREGAKTIANLGMNALISHGATEMLRDTKLNRGQKNEEFWRAFRLGYPPPSPKVPMVYEKFIASLKGAGINVKKTGNQMHLMAMTDKDIDKLSRGEIKNPETVDGRTLQPIPGGLFDRGLTGAHGGQHWTHIKLNEPMPNPVMEEPIRRLLGLTQKKLEAIVAGDEKLHGRTGGTAIQEALSRLKIDEEIDKARMEVKSRRGAGRSDAVKRLRYLETAKKQGMSLPDMVITKVPVLPPNFRPINAIKDGVQIVNDANMLYQDLMYQNEALQQVSERLGSASAQEERANVYKALKATVGLGDPVHPKLQEQNVQGLLKHVFGKGSPKMGMYQRRVIGMAAKESGRAVISPNPSLDMDQVGLPEEQAWKVYKPFVVRRLTRAGMPAAEAARAVEEQTDRARQELVKEMDNRPIVITRAPTLHRYGIMGAYPVLTKGHTLQISPIVTSGFNADFDGNCVDFNTEIICKFSKSALYSSNKGDGALILEDMKTRLGSAEDIVIRDADEFEVRMPIGLFPRVGVPVKDKNGADVYTVPDGIEIISFDHTTGDVYWSPITHFTEERDVSSVKVTTSQKKEVVVSDNESLCVFDAVGCNLVKAAPRECIGRLMPVVVQEPFTANKLPETADIVPVPAAVQKVVSELSLDVDKPLYAAALKAKNTCSMPREAALRAVDLLEATYDSKPVAVQWFIATARNTAVHWDTVKTVEDAGTRDVYDFAIPGTKVFMIANGLIIYDTMSYHVPVSDEAVEDVKKKMLPSKNLREVKDFDVHYIPKYEYQLGLYKATQAAKTGERSDGKPRKTHTFATKADVIKAFKRGEIDVEDEVVVKGD